MGCTHSTSDDDQVIKEDELHEEPRITSKSLPYQSLLVRLHTLYQQQPLVPFPSFVHSTQQEFWTLQQDVKLQQMIFVLLLNHGVRSQSLKDIQTMAETEAEQILKLAEDIFELDYGPEPRKLYRARWESALSKSQEALHQKIKPHLIEIVDGLLQGNLSTGEYCSFEFINVILLKLKDFKKLKPNVIDPVKKQMQILEEMLNYALIIASKMTNLDENLQNFLEYFEPWVNTAAAIVILYCVDEKDEINILKFGCKCYFLVRLSSYFKKLESLKLHIPTLLEKEAISPSKLDFSITLKKLNLNVYERLSSAMMSSIGKLNNLEVLKLTANFENDIWNVEDDEFLQLKYFYFSSKSVQEWNVSDESFPCLEQLFASHCHELKELPARFGSVATLRRIEACCCSGNLSNSFEQIVDDQINAGNEGLQTEKLDGRTMKRYF